IRVAHRPARTRHLPRLVEETAFGARERKLLVRAHPALLEFLLARRGLHDVMTAIIKYGHDPFCPKPVGPCGQWGSVGSVAPTSSTEGASGDVPTLKQLLRWSEALSGIAR